MCRTLIFVIVYSLLFNIIYWLPLDFIAKTGSRQLLNRPIVKSLGLLRDLTGFFFCKPSSLVGYGVLFSYNSSINVGIRLYIIDLYSKRISLANR